MNAKKTALVCLCLVMAMLPSAFLAGCQSPAQTETDQPLISPIAEAAAFASYREVPVDLRPSVAPYRAAEDLSNITNRNQFEFSPEARKLLSSNGFFVEPSPMREFFSIYEIDRYSSIPSFVTTDAMLHNYHLYFSHLLRTLEKDSLRQELAALTESLLGKSQEQYQSLKSTEWETAARRNVAFFAVAGRLLDSGSEIPSFVGKEVNEELRLISEHRETFFPSPVMNMGASSESMTDLLNEDYTQYLPRGHYTKSDELKSYFRTMMWYGRMTFRASSDEETKSAALITLLLGRQQEDYDRWNRIYEPTNFFVGKSDDLGFLQYLPLLKETYGQAPLLTDLTEDPDKWEAFRADIAKLEPPAVNSMPIFDETIQPDREQVIKGFRFMGQRFTLDASIFQRLIYREVGENSQAQRRMLPKGLDIPAAMGSREAYEILKDMGETDYKNYPENMKKLQSHITALDTGVWTQNLYWSWLYTLAPLTESKGEGYPSFMRNQAWERKQLETYLGNWAELKHDTVLYAKQVYAEMGGGDEPVDDRGYVEPNPVVYARLASLTRMTMDGLQSRGLLPEGAGASLERMEELAIKLKVISEKELAQEALSDEEYDLIRSFGGQLEHFWMEAMKDEGIDHPSAVYENPSSLISDVATDPGGQVLEAGTGFVSNIYAVVPVDGTLRIAKGAVYSYYEFSWPSEDRLTDEKWKQILEEGKAPAQPDWTRSYTLPADLSQW